MYMLLHQGNHPFYVNGDTKDSLKQKLLNPD